MFPARFIHWRWKEGLSPLKLKINTLLHSWYYQILAWLATNPAIFTSNLFGLNSRLNLCLWMQYLNCEGPRHCIYFSCPGQGTMTGINSAIDPVFFTKAIGKPYFHWEVTVYMKQLFFIQKKNQFNLIKKNKLTFLFQLIMNKHQRPWISITLLFGFTNTVRK